jgi:probable rRNA maturation factor
MIAVDISYETEAMEERAPHDVVEKMIVRTLELLGEESGELSCTFVGDETMREMNHTYRGKDESTDILSFVQSEDDTDFPFPEMEDQQDRVLGDMVISLDTMERNCDYFKVPAREELIRLLIHGVLHLLGWDHETNGISEPMLIKQEDLLKNVTKESER